MKDKRSNCLKDLQNNVSSQPPGETVACTHYLLQVVAQLPAHLFGIGFQLVQDVGMLGAHIILLTGVAAQVVQCLAHGHVLGRGARIAVDTGGLPDI